jgi:hypothetical protein
MYLTNRLVEMLDRLAGEAPIQVLVGKGEHPQLDGYKDGALVAVVRGVAFHVASDLPRGKIRFMSRGQMRELDLS